MSELVAKKPLIASFAFPRVYFPRENSLSFSAEMFAAMINAVTKAGYSNESPENVGGSLTGR